MSYSPAGNWNPSVGLITPWSAESIGVGLVTTATTSAVSTGTWPSANLAIYVPFEVSATVTVSAAAYYSNAATGNFDVGVYSSAGTRLVSKGSTAIATGFNVVSLTSTLLLPGRYYMGFVHSATQSFWRVVPAVPIGAALGVKQQTSALPLPSSATFSDLAQAFVPAFGLSIASVNP